MAISKESLDYVLSQWAVYYLSEFNEVGWQKTSLSGRMMEAAKVGVFSRGTKSSTEFTTPEEVEMVQSAIIWLPIIQQHVIKEEYTGRGTQREKAKRLKLSIQNYRARLCRARYALRMSI